jgi:hypothetical protein
MTSPTTQTSTTAAPAANARAPKPISPYLMQRMLVYLDLGYSAERTADIVGVPLSICRLYKASCVRR